MVAMNWGNCSASPSGGAAVGDEVLSKVKANPSGLPFLFNADPTKGSAYFSAIKKTWDAANYHPAMVVGDIENSTTELVKASICNPLSPIPFVGQGVQPISYTYHDANGNPYPVGSTSPSGYSSPEMYDAGGNFYNGLKLPVDWNSCGKTCLDAIALTGGGQHGDKFIPWVAYSGFSNNGHQWNVRTFQLRWRLLVLKVFDVQTVLYWNPKGAGESTDRDDRIFADALAWANNVGHILVTNSSRSQIVMDSQAFVLGGGRYVCRYSDFLASAVIDAKAA